LEPRPRASEGMGCEREEEEEEEAAAEEKEGGLMGWS
jgi:hypothetical protein